MAVEQRLREQDKRADQSESDSPAPGRSVREWLADHSVLLVGLTTLLGLLLRLEPFRSSMSGDEIATYYIIHGHSLSRVLQLVHSNLETTPPGYFVVAWLVNRVVDDSALAARLVSLIAGVVAIPLTYVLGVLAFRQRVTALLGALLIALAPFMIFFSTEGRAFALVMTLGLISTIGLLKSVRTNAVGWWFVYGVSSLAAVYTHYTVVFLLGLQLFWALLCQRKVWMGVLATNIIVFLAYLPWLSGLEQDIRAPNALGSLLPFSLNNAGNVTLDWWIGHPFIPVGLLPGHVAVVLAALGLALGGSALLVRSSHIARLRTTEREQILIPLLAVGPPLLMIIYSCFRTSILDGRNFLISWPTLALAMAALVLLPRLSWARWLAVGLLLAAYAIGTVTSLLPVNQRPDADAVVAYIRSHAGRNDPLVDFPFFTNPLSEIDVALARDGASTYTPGPEADRDPIITSPGHHHVFRLQALSLAAQLRSLAGPNGQPIHHGPVQSPAMVAQQTARVASRISDGQFVLVGPSLKVVEYFPQSPAAEFFRALPTDDHIVSSVEIAGYGGLVPSYVYIIQPRAAAKSR